MLVDLEGQASMNGEGERQTDKISPAESTLFGHDTRAVGHLSSTRCP
jgi:hypothetical protein